MLMEKYITLILLCIASFLNAQDFDKAARSDRQQNTGTFRSGCVESRSETDLNVNNVRARLRAGGDMWWDGAVPQYIVPNVDPTSGNQKSFHCIQELWLELMMMGET